MKFEENFFTKFNFSKKQINKNLENAIKDFDIAQKDQILDVKFNYAYSSLLKSGITLLSQQKVKIKSRPGHHIKIIESLSEILKDETIAEIGNIMRTKRNVDLYAGGIEVTEKECQEYIDFVAKVLSRVKNMIQSNK